MMGNFDLAHVWLTSYPVNSIGYSVEGKTCAVPSENVTTQSLGFAITTWPP